MRYKYAALLISAIGFLALSAQEVSYFYYQMGVRDGIGMIISEEVVEIRVTIIENEVNGPSVYAETHTQKTSPQGIVNLIIGNGEVVSGNFNNIAWGVDKYFLALEIKLPGESAYTEMGRSEILAVPISNYSHTSGGISDSWQVNNNVSFILEGSVGIGTSSTIDGESQSRLQAEYTGNNALTTGERRVIRTYLDINTPHLNCYTESALGLGRTFDNHSIGLGVFGSVKNIKLLNNNTSWPTGVAGGTFDIHLNDPVFNNPNGGYWISGVECNLYGTITNPPDGAIISALFVNDNIDSTNTYAGYFRGKVYLQDNVGVGIKAPERSLHINDVMRLEPVDSPPSDPKKGDIYMDNITNKLRVFDGIQWQDCW